RAKRLPPGAGLCSCRGRTRWPMALPSAPASAASGGTFGALGLMRWSFWRAARKLQTWSVTTPPSVHARRLSAGKVHWAFCGGHSN
ncbi:unnamed protein product, partial [Effrenium voratum]